MQSDGKRVTCKSTNKVGGVCNVFMPLDDGIPSCIQVVRVSPISLGGLCVGEVTGTKKTRLHLRLWYLRPKDVPTFEFTMNSRAHSWRDGCYSVFNCLYQTTNELVRKLIQYSISLLLTADVLEKRRCRLLFLKLLLRIER